MKKKASLIVLSVVIAAQIVLTSFMAVYGYNADKIIEKYGKEYKFQVSVRYVYDDTVEFVFTKDSYCEMSFYGRNAPYAEIKTNEKGISKIEEAEEKNGRPEEYISLTNENAFPRVCDYELKSADDTKPDSTYNFTMYNYEETQKIRELDAYLTVKIWHGQPLVTGLYIDGQKAEDFIAEYKEAEDTVIFDDEDDIVDFDELDDFE